ncbi:MAG: TadE/TadG family type IV pilus assembly protein [Arenibacterium sp.]
MAGQVLVDPAASSLTLFGCIGDLMRVLSLISKRLARFCRDQSGVALTEFAIILPMTLLVFAIVIEGGRMFWSYQTAIAGVRDAARYVARIAPADICVNGGSIATYSNDVSAIVKENIAGQTLFPSGISVTSVGTTLNCFTGTYRLAQVPVVQVSATLNITFPFSSLMAFAGYTQPAITTRIADEHRVLGT